MQKLLFVALIALGLTTTTMFASADAGPEQYVLSNETVQLDGTNSTLDNEGYTPYYRWQQVLNDNAPQVDLNNSTSATATFVAPEVNEITELIFGLYLIERYNCGNNAERSINLNRGRRGPQLERERYRNRCQKYITYDEVSIFISPNDNNDSNVTGPIDGSANITIGGTIIDTNGTGIQNALVTIGTQTVTTDIYGNYTIANVTASDRLSVNVTHPDYLKNSRIVDVNLSDVTLDITLDMPKASLTFDASVGAVVTENSGASVSLPANGYIDENGSTYTGLVTVKMAYYAITTQSGRDTFPGTFEGTDGNTTFPIQSYGFMNVELTDANGNPLNLDGNATATLTYPVDTSLGYTSVIPLWYYDEALGYWVEEGEAVLENYAYYVGTVKHFTSWNLDAKGPRAELQGCVEDVNGIRISAASVQFRAINWDSRTVPTDANGDISVYNILAEADLTFSAYKKIGDIWYYGEYPSSLFLTTGETRVISDCVVLEAQTNLPGTVTVTGTIMEYDYATATTTPAVNRTVSIYASTGYVAVATGTTNADGTFSITFQTVDSLSYSVSGKTFILQENKTIYDVETITIDICTMEVCVR